MRLYFVFYMLSLLVPRIGYADDVKLSFSGFASLAVSYLDDPDIGFRSNYLNRHHSGWSALQDTTLGGQVNIEWRDNWDSVVQVVLQDREHRQFNNFLELAFVRFRANPNWSIRAGRINSDLYLLSEYSYVSYAYLWVRPPQDYYSFATTARHLDGLDIEYKQTLGEGFLQLKLAGGSTQPKVNEGENTIDVKFDNLLSLSAVYSTYNWTLRASSSRADTNIVNATGLNQVIGGLHQIPAALWVQADELANGLNSAGHDIRYNALGIAYDSDPWLLQAEFGNVRSDWLVVPSSNAGYISVGRRFDDLTYYASVSVTRKKGQSPRVVAPELPDYLPIEVITQTQQLAAITDTIIKRSSVDQSSLSLGVKWHAASNLVVKAQLDRFNIRPEGGALWKIEQPADMVKSHQINLFSLSASVVF